jgi:hypothetical protein
MPAPDYQWLPKADLLEQITAPDDARLELARQAACDYVERVKPALVWVDAVPADVPAGVRAGAVLMVSRLLARRGAPLGLAEFGNELGTAARVVANDPDVERLLGIGRYAKPQVR